jgi:hypothetical protein
LKGKRIAVGVPGSGTRTLVERLTKASGINEDNTALLALEDEQAFQALKAGEVEAAFFVGGPGTPAINKALRDSEIVTIGARRAEGFTRQFPFLNKLILPTGAIDLALNIPDHDVTLLGTKAMLVAHNDLHPALINLLLDTARGMHGEQGTFEEAGEFPGTAPVDLPVSPYAEQHRRFGPSLLYHYLPFWLAAAIERTIIIVVPLLFVLVPALRYVPQALRSRTRSRIIRWYGELALLERDMRTRRDTLPVAQWLQDLDRIETAVAETWVPTTFAGELYTLREHIDLVRREIAAKAATHGASPGHGSASG